MNNEPCAPGSWPLRGKIDRTGKSSEPVIVTVDYLERARTLVAAEADRTRAERNAFGAFARRVEEFEPVASSPRPAGEPAALGFYPESRATGQVAHRVADAYRETVMAVPHYEVEYGEPLAISMRAEFGADVVAAVLDDGQFSPTVERVFRERVRAARSKRETILTKLDGEATSLDTFEATLEATDAERQRLACTSTRPESFATLRERWTSLAALRDRCETVLETRQRELQRGARTSQNRDGLWYLLKYTYAPLPVRFPVLAAGVALHKRLDDESRVCLRALATSG